MRALRLSEPLFDVPRQETRLEEPIQDALGRRFVESPEPRRFAHREVEAGRFLELFADSLDEIRQKGFHGLYSWNPEPELERNRPRGAGGGISTTFDPCRPTVVLSPLVSGGACCTASKLTSDD
jgi:hypothetical protein